MKSALELALERANETVGGEENIKLNDEQKVAIDQIRKLYEAKWAEKELQINARTAKLENENPEGMAEARAELQREINVQREEIFSERDAKIEEVRQQHR
ncbi:MAG: hypothetical protein VX294_06770 [Candidatus Latescibacterota bacterium]|nr:hypothetical protein [Candidatus Latescibacterota bacterium]